MTQTQIQIERIEHMEKCLDDGLKAVRELSLALSAYRMVQGELRELSGYYGSEEWQNDFDDDREGRLPENLKRGVLSEDAVYDLLSENRELQAEILEVMSGIIREGRY